MRDLFDRVSWPARRYLCDLLIGQHAYSRNVAYPTATEIATMHAESMRRVASLYPPGSTYSFNYGPLQPFDQERSA